MNFIFYFIVFLVNLSYTLTAFYSQDRLERIVLPSDAIPVVTNSTTECIMVCKDINHVATMWKSNEDVYKCYCTKENNSNNDLYEESYQSSDNGFYFTNVNVTSKPSNSNINIHNNNDTFMITTIQPNTTEETITHPVTYRGKTKENPADSCLHIKYENENLKSGYYWIYVNQSILVYCDQETDGGGWMMVTNFTITSQTDAVLPAYNSDMSKLHEVSTGRFIADTVMLKSFNQLMTYGIDHIRIYCYKPSVNRTLHFRNTRGEGLAFRDAMFNVSINWLEGTNGCPHAFQVFSDDNSMLMDTCAKGSNWSTEYDDGNHSELTPSNRLYCHPVYERGHYHVQLTSNRIECDDEVDLVKNPATFPGTGTWQYFIR